jgi:hypothetical protein
MKVDNYKKFSREWVSAVKIISLILGSTESEKLNKVIEDVGEKAQKKEEIVTALTQLEQEKKALGDIANRLKSAQDKLTALDTQSSKEPTSFLDSGGSKYDW